MQSAERPARRKRANSFRSILGLLICVVCFSAFSYAFSPLDLRSAIESDPVAPLCGIVFWIGWRWRGEADRLTIFLLIERFCIGAGLSITFQALLTYSEILEPSPPLAVVVGGLASGVILVIIQTWLYPRREGAILLIGCDELGASIAASLQPAPAGAVEQEGAQLPPNVTYLGRFDQLPDIIASQRPAKIVLDKRNWQDVVSPRFLLDCKSAGIKIEEAADTYQDMFLRVSVTGLHPSELVWSPVFRANRLAMAAQTIYSNLVGLVAVVVSSPVLLAGGIISALAAGSGRMFERTECAGFQGIPFWRLRFRTRHVKTGELTWAGKIIESQRLGNLPQVINVVRGEMALFGPQPVRAAFVPRLKELIPFYSQKLTVKPGLLGWSQVHARQAEEICEEVLRMEYDIYYLTQCSPSLDFEIFARSVIGRRAAPELAQSP